MAYRAEIEIGVRGSSRLKELQDRITRLSRNIDDVNVKTLIDRNAVQSVESYTQALSKAATNLREVTVQLDAAGRASGNYADAISQYVTALDQSNAAQKLQNDLIADEIELRRKQKLAASGIRESTQYGGPIGPGPASPVGMLVGQTSPVEERLSRTLKGKREQLELDQALLELEKKSAERLNDTVRLQNDLVEGTREVYELIAQTNREAATGIRPSTQYAGPIGPGPASPVDALVGQTSPVEEKLAAGMRKFNEEKAFKNLRFDTIQQSLRAELDSVDEVLNARIQADKKYLAEFDKRLNTRLANKNVSSFRTDGPLESRGFKSTKKSIGKMGESLALGAGFPLLFGGGAGSVLGSVLGSFVGTGFGGQILGGALGQALDQAVAAAARLSNTLATVGDNFSKIREEGLYFTAELEKQVRLAKESGGVSQASNLLNTAVTAQTGDVGGLAGRGAAAAVNELQKAWNGVTKAVGTTLSIIAGPFIFALNAALRGVQLIFFLFNGIATSLGNLINLIPGAKQVGDALYEQSLKGTAEYESQLAELDKQIKAEYELVELAKVRTGYLEQMLGKSEARRDILNKEADAAERLKKFEQEIKQFRASAPSGTSELREKAFEKEDQMRLKFAENEKQILLKNAADLFNAIQENNKRVADAQRAYDEQRIDMVRAATRTQADFDLQAVRRLEDARIKMREQELNYINKIRQEELETQRLLDRERQLQRSITGALSADPEQAEIINTVQTAVENYRTGRMAVEEEARAAQEQAQLQYSKAQTQIERYKYDNALRINRANEDSQIKIAKINDQIRRQNEEASKKEFDRQIYALKARIQEQVTAARVEYFPAKAALDQEKARPGSLTPEDVKIYQAIFDRAEITLGEFMALSKRIDETFKTIQSAKLQPMAALPSLTDTSGAASAAETAANTQLLAYQRQIQKLQQINGLKNEELQLAQALLAPGADSLKQFNDLIKQQKDRAAYEREYGELLRKGIKPELAEQLAVINQMEEAQLRLLDNVINTIEALNNDEFKDILDRLKEIRGGVTTKAEEARAGVVDVVPGQRLQEFIAKGEDELKDLEALAIRVADGIGNAIADSMTQGIQGLIEGTQSAQEVFANFLKSVGDMLAQEGARMIATYIAIGIAKIFAGLASAGSSGGGTTSYGGGNVSTNAFNTGGIPGISSTGSVANAGGFTSAGGMFSNPSFGVGGMANGGAVKAATPYLVGERGPELFVPGTSGGVMSNSDLRASMGAAPGSPNGGSVLNMSFETSKINGVEYVSRDQLEAAMAMTRRQAAKDGASRGMSMTLDRIQQSPQTRRKIGIG